MGWLISAGVAVAGSLPLLASATNPGACDEPKPINMQWLGALHADSVGDFGTLQRASPDMRSASVAASRMPNATVKYVAVLEKALSGSVVSAFPRGASITFNADEHPRIYSGTKVPSIDAVVVGRDRLLSDATEFGKHLRNLGWQPEVWSDESEVVFEWISNERHAVVSIEGDGVIGYTMLVGDEFVSGAVDDPSVTSFPDDLKEYISAA